MCGFCTGWSGSPHWTEGGSNAAYAQPTDDGATAREARRRRVALADHLARFYGCRVEDWQGEHYVVRSLRGQTELVRELPQVWQTIEGLSASTVDPLAADLLAYLRANRPT
jgi:hypothetical protein